MAYMGLFFVYVKKNQNMWKTMKKMIKEVEKMGFIELFLMGAGLSMDAFAVAVCKGLKMCRVNKKQAFVIGLFFGGFQALMPLIGWLLGTRFAAYIKSVDHWIAFVLLALIGGNMIREAVSGDDESSDDGIMDPPLDIKELAMLAVATSIDALAAGITFAFLNVSIVPAVALIGCTTFVISIGGVVIGKYFGNKYEKRASFAGGVILILIGTKILMEHLIG